MSDTPRMEDVQIPTDKDFEEFRTLCVEDDGWSEVYKDSKYKVWSRKVLILQVIFGLINNDIQCAQLETENRFSLKN